MTDPIIPRFSKGQTAPEGGDLYRKRTIVRMWGPMPSDFVCESREGELTGRTGDYLAQDGHGGFYPVSAEFHAANYVIASCRTCGRPLWECCCVISASERP